MTESLVDLGLAILCETCESEIEFADTSPEGICRHCGLAFLIDVTQKIEPSARHVAS